MLEFWLNEVKDLHDYNAMVVSSVDASGQPHSRVVLLRGVNEDGLKFYTNYSSNKGQELEQNNKVAVNFFWPTVERQIIIKGTAKQTSEQISDNYFASRPEGSKLGAIVSAQSEVVDNRDYLEYSLSALEKEWEGKIIERPKHWGGFIVRPVEVEFWQGRPNRLHDRIRYQLQKDCNWKIERLAP
jgi:pyridoxamine 5'-phosphate oxidase